MATKLTLIYLFIIGVFLALIHPTEGIGTDALPSGSGAAIGVDKGGPATTNISFGINC
jgi:hypothetical protein